MSYSAIHIESEINGLLIFKKDHRCILRFSRLLIPNYLVNRSRREHGTLQCAISPQSRNRSYNSVSPYRYGMPIHSQTISKNTERNHPQLFHLKKDLHIQSNQPKHIYTYKRNVQQTIEFKRTSRLRFTLSWQQPRHEPDGRQSCWDPLSSHQEPAQRLRICGCTALASTTHIRFHAPTLARPTWDFPFSCLSTFGVWFFTFPARVREPCILPPPRRRSTKCRVDSF